MPVFPWWDVSAHRFWKQSKLLQKHLAVVYKAIVSSFSVLKAFILGY
jgi:hypothetical protein